MLKAVIFEAGGTSRSVQVQAQDPVAEILKISNTILLLLRFPALSDSRPMLKGLPAAMASGPTRVKVATSKYRSLIAKKTPQKRTEYCSKCYCSECCAARQKSLIAKQTPQKRTEYCSKWSCSEYCAAAPWATSACALHGRVLILEASVLILRPCL